MTHSTGPPGPTDREAGAPTRTPLPRTTKPITTCNAAVRLIGTGELLPAPGMSSADISAVIAERATRALVAAVSADQASHPSSHRRRERRPLVLPRVPSRHP